MTGFPVIGFTLMALFLVLVGLILVRVAMVRRARPAMGPLPSVAEPPAPWDRH